MRRKRAWNRNSNREIGRTLGRFLSIFAIVALGVGTFSGLKVSQNAMIDTADLYLKQNNMFDNRLVSTIGLEDADVTAFAALDGVDAAEGSVSTDAIVSIESGASYVLRAHSITTEINRLKLTTGRMPQADDECLGDARMLPASMVGTRIQISADNDEDTLDAFAYDEYTIVGLTDSTSYLNMERGTTKLAGGKVRAYVYIPAGGFSTDYYSEIYVSLSGADGKIYSDAYDNAVAAMEEPLKALLTTRADQRYRNLIEEAQAEIADAEQEYQDGLEEYETQKADAEKELDDAADALHDAKYAIRAGWHEIDTNEAQLDEAEALYNAGLAAYQTALSDYESAKESAFALLDASQTAIDNQRALLNEAMAAAEASGDPAQIAAVQAQLDALDLAQAQLDAQRAATEQQFAQAQAELDANKATLDASKDQIDEGRVGIRKGKYALYLAQQEYDEGYQDYLDAKDELDEKLAEAQQELDDARIKIDDAKEELSDVKRPKVYVLDRETNPGYVNFENDASIVNGISKVFPVFFFLIAALVTMTTMTRMVEEQRTHIGTFKALGYSNGIIAWKYISYAGSAALLGCLAGFYGGSWLFPWTIWQAYGMLYGFAPIIYTLDWSLFFISLAVSLLSSAGVTYLTCRAELRLMPAELMRPKAPKEGKRVLLERIPFLWKRFGFMLKISLRNVFRYTRRLIMMVLGIGGCTALLITGFGIRDSIANIASDQFDNIMIYDFEMTFDEEKNPAEQAQFIEETKGILSACVFVCDDTLQTDTREGIKNVNVVATGDPNISSLISMHADGQTLDYPPNGSVAISEKLALIAGVSAGDTIRVTVDDTRTTEITVSGVFENFVYHYMVMTPATYETIFGEACSYNAALADTTAEDMHATAAALLNDYDASSVTVTTDIKDSVSNMMRSLNLVIYVIIACAGALAFVVLFNLSNINITERIREIATIKVLGFYAPEVGAYVFRENLVLTLLGTLVGIPLGIWLHSFVIGQLSFYMVNFHVIIKPLSYLLSVIMTFVFAFGVDIFMRPRLAKIDMVESLKAIE